MCLSPDASYRRINDQLFYLEKSLQICIDVASGKNGQMINLILIVLRPHSVQYARSPLFLDNRVLLIVIKSVISQSLRMSAKLRMDLRSHSELYKMANDHTGVRGHSNIRTDIL